MPEGLTFTNSPILPPNSVFMCFVWIWEQTVIISLHNIDWFSYLGVFTAGYELNLEIMFRFISVQMRNLQSEEFRRKFLLSVWIRSEIQQPHIQPTALLPSFCPRFRSLASAFKISRFAQNWLVMAIIASFEVMFGKYTITSPYTLGFDPKGVHVSFFMNKVAQKQDFLPVFPS